MTLDPDKSAQLFTALMDTMIRLLEPRYDDEGKLVPVPASVLKEVREFLKDNDVYSMTPADQTKAQRLLDQAGALFEPGVYHN